MQITDTDLKNFNDKGFLIKKNVLNKEEVNRIKAIILQQKSGKGGKNSYYPPNYRTLFIKILKFDIERFLSAIFFFKSKKETRIR